MAKHLFIIRHAKSDWSFGVSDFDRPLNPRGFRNAPEMADRLVAYTDQPPIVKPQMLVSSPAKRAITTAQIFAKHLGIPVHEIVQEPSIYEAMPHGLLEIINRLDNRAESVAFFGHNPGFTALVNYLGDKDLYNLTTSGIVHLRFDDTDDWAEISRGTGTNVWHAEPVKED